MNVRRHIIQGDTHRNALSQPYPTKGGVNVGQQRSTGSDALTNLNASRETLYMPLLRTTLTYDVNGCRHPFPDMGQLSLLEISSDVVAVLINQGHQWLPVHRIRARTQGEVGNDAVEWCTHSEAGQINAGALQSRLCTLTFRDGFPVDRHTVVLFLARYRIIQTLITQVLAPSRISQLGLGRCHDIGEPGPIDGEKHLLMTDSLIITHYNLTYLS